MIYVFLAEGFEECEALIPVDILRRGGLDVKTVGIDSKNVIGAHGIPVICDISESEVKTEDIEAVILPGGMPGTVNLEKNKTVSDAVDYAVKHGILIGAICAAPSILGHKNYLKSKKATCYPGFEDDLIGAEFCDVKVVKDGNIITACGAGAAFEFGFMLLSTITGDEESAKKLSKAMKY